MNKLLEKFLPSAELDGPRRTIRIEPIETPDPRREPREAPAEEPVPAQTPERQPAEPVPA